MFSVLTFLFVICDLGLLSPAAACDALFEEANWSDMKTEYNLQPGNKSAFQALQVDLNDQHKLLAVFGYSVVTIELTKNFSIKNIAGLPDKFPSRSDRERMQYYCSGDDAILGELIDMVQISNEVIVVSDYTYGCLKSINRTSREVFLYSGMCTNSLLERTAQDGPSITTAKYSNPEAMALYHDSLFVIDVYYSSTYIRHINLSTDNLMVSTFPEKLTDYPIALHVISSNKMLTLSKHFLRFKEYNETRNKLTTSHKVSLSDMGTASLYNNYNFAVLSTTTVAYFGDSSLNIFDTCSGKLVKYCQRGHQDGDLRTCRQYPISLLFVNNTIYIGESGIYGGGLRSIQFKGQDCSGEVQARNVSDTVCWNLQPSSNSKLQTTTANAMLSCPNNIPTSPNSITIRRTTKMSSSTENETTSSLVSSTERNGTSDGNHQSTPIKTWQSLSSHYSSTATLSFIKNRNINTLPSSTSKERSLGRTYPTPTLSYTNQQRNRTTNSGNFTLKSTDPVKEERQPTDLTIGLLVSLPLFLVILAVILGIRLRRRHKIRQSNEASAGTEPATTSKTQRFYYRPLPDIPDPENKDSEFSDEYSGYAGMGAEEQCDNGAYAENVKNQRPEPRPQTMKPHVPDGNGTYAEYVKNGRQEAVLHIMKPEGQDGNGTYAEYVKNEKQEAVSQIVKPEGQDGNGTYAEYVKSKMRQEPEHRGDIKIPPISV